MKQLVFCLSCILISFMVIACEKDDTASRAEPGSVDPMELPNTLLVDVDPASVEAAKQAKVHTAKFIILDPDDVADQFLQEEVTAHCYGIVQKGSGCH
ncbi:hypothetical protein SAMN05421736_10955 [Evansella caseinilytica]|uniref:Uncharacterized protein n=1 Tax=Evansella caseinilytica TaxID=1503961 RepID=A0A1H3RU93_9BACI|nr:hypothetical protein [Evansella caseinilytica]SDZ29190.1 hypothetical protein SAMN05421736_10955 [Evansella caseinilytica]